MPYGTVKFFNAAKRFGFISPDVAGPDVFVHSSAVERAGLDQLNEGDKVVFEIERDRRTGKAFAVALERLASSSRGPSRAPDRVPRESQSEGSRAAGDRAGSGVGLVKWFDPAKGFGFIQPSDGGKDVFVHTSALRKAGLQGLDEGQTIAYDLQSDRRSGKVAAVNLRIE